LDACFQDLPLTASHKVVANGHAKGVERVVQSGASSVFANKDGRTPLAFGVFCKCLTNAHL